MNLLLSIVLTAMLSPIWPLGGNPIVGDPFIIVNKQSNQAAFIDEGKIQKVFHIATGKRGDLTPEGTFNIIVKAKNPYYRRQDIPGGDPDNPLGTRWIGFDAKGTDGRIYGLHGTNSEDSIGRYATAGCIRFLNHEVEWLYDHVPLGTKVKVVNTAQSFEQIAIEERAIEESHQASP